MFLPCSELLLSAVLEEGECAETNVCSNITSAKGIREKCIIQEIKKGGKFNLAEICYY